jgi:hypothetical protein
MTTDKHPDSAQTPRRGLASVARVAAGIVALVAVAALIWDFVDPPATGGSEASQQGGRVGFGIGTVVRTAILGGVAAALFAKSRALANPGRFGKVAVVRDELAAIASAQRDRVVPEPTAANGFYAAYSDADLVDVYQHTSPETAPDRLAELVLEIRRRVGA